MLKLNINRVCKLRNIGSPYKFMMAHGFSHMTALNLMHGKTLAPKTEHIERLCRLLNCTPNDLYEWMPEDNLPETHPLNTLQREKPKNLNDLIKDLPLEKLPEIEALLKQVKGES